MEGCIRETDQPGKPREICHKVEGNENQESRLRVALVMPFFFTNRIAAISRYIVELVLRDSRFSYTLITTQSAQCRTFEVGFDHIVQINAEGHGAFYRQASEMCGFYDLVAFYGGYPGALLFMRSFAGKPVPKLLNLFSYKFSIKELRHLKKTDYCHAFRRIFMHQHFWSGTIPTGMFQRYFQNCRIKKIICPSHRLTRIYRRIAGENNCVCLRPGGDISKIEECGQELPSGLAQRLNGKITVLHSGLASVLRGADDVIRAYAAMPERLRSSGRLLLCLYVRPGEKIYSVKEIRKVLDQYLRDEEYILWDTPVLQMDKVYSIADICVFPYRYCGDIPEVPLTLVELANLGKRVISNDIGCIGELLPKNNLCSAGNITELRDKLASQIDDLLAERIEAPSDGYGKFGWDTYVNGYVKELWEAIQ
ncbi:MAG: glycosyltransferase [Deltaproteobacteria bacterium]|nr:glycosyltransferase [Deltaproteobacteria bacterium]